MSNRSFRTAATIAAVLATVVAACSSPGPAVVITPGPSASASPVASSSAFPTTSPLPSLLPTINPSFGSPPPASVPPVSAPPSVSTEPQATVVRDNARLRLGDSNAYPVVASIPNGAILRITGISSTGSGWYRVRYNNARGFINPEAVTVTGDLSQVRRVNPPPLPTATPATTPTTTPLPDIAIKALSLTPTQPTCGLAFDVNVLLINRGDVDATVPFKVYALATLEAGDVQVDEGSVDVPAGSLPPFIEYSTSIELNVPEYHGQQINILVTADSDGAVAESRENNNDRTISYTPQQGGCV